ncbi:bifunctional folylpolyglutamate synthase/dihydrofolate synthase [Flavobacterium inviolabile]|uniref:bifunctional folylpolyglutamate synthase/dihydrofolate synthase n=1 Tax=Flavobacterium inviolabile TaxID=2748320 RepID=UPI0015AF74A7|nr:folylpolyglutamate synthase/dihydrofolate synthase family protein [Flavobacterium inviolabile]
MNYQETLNWMFAQLPMFQQQGASAYKKDLTNTLLLCKHLNNPEKGIRTIHVAGTNGKGSTSSMIASVLQEAGYKTGLYTSPHLKDFRERIKIDGVEIPETYVCDFIARNKAFFESGHLSFFEMTVGLAFEYFKDQQVDVAVIEVGMGGRLDSTNVIAPLVSVITNIGFDHTQFLGDTYEAIAFEKAGIIKPGIPVVVGEYNAATQPVFIAKAKECASEIYFASDLEQQDYPIALLGDYQVHNKKTVLQTIDVLKNVFTISEENIKNGLWHVVKNTGLHGRWEQVHSNPKAICDTAHNSHGLKIVLNQIKKEPFEKLFFVLGVVNDKDLETILPLFPKNAKYFFCKPNVQRGLEASVLQQKAAGFELFGEVYNSVSEAYAEALHTAGKDDFIYVGGSTFVVAEIL